METYETMQNAAPMMANLIHFGWICLGGFMAAVAFFVYRIVRG